MALCRGNFYNAGTTLRSTSVRLGLAIGLVSCFVWPETLWAVQGDPLTTVDDVRTFFGLSPRTVVWFVAQLHLLFAAFVLGVPIFAVIVEFIGWRTGDQRYDRLAHEFTKLLAAAFATTAALGGLLAFTLYGLYPKFSNYFVGIFAPSMYVYAGIFFAETALLYLYYNSWHRLSGRKGLHISLGVLLNVVGTALCPASLLRGTPRCPRGRTNSPKRTSGRSSWRSTASPARNRGNRRERNDDAARAGSVAAVRLRPGAVARAG